MSLKLLAVSSMYPGSLTKFYHEFQGIEDANYVDYYNTLFSFSTEFVASYVSTFCKLGIDASAIIANDKIFQKKWNEQFSKKSIVDKRLIYKQICEIKPDILWIEDLRYVSVNDLVEVRENLNYVKLIIAYHCAPFDSDILKKLECCDFVITCTPGLRIEFEKEGIRSFLVYHGFDSSILSDLKSEEGHFLHNVIFSGSLSQGEGYHRERITLINHLLKNGIKLSLYVNIESHLRIFVRRVLYLMNRALKNIGISKQAGLLRFLKYGKVPVSYYPHLILKALKKPEYGSEMYQLLMNSRIVLNNHGTVAGNYAGNMRIFEATGVGSCLLTDAKSNLKDLFDINNEIVVYHDAEECADKIKWLLENEEERKLIALAGQRRTLQYHTVESRCKDIIEIIQSELKNQKNQKSE